MANEFPDVITLLEIGKSFEGRPLYVIKVTLSFNVAIEFLITNRLNFGCDKYYGCTLFFSHYFL